jgi:hypothetical protein
MLENAIRDNNGKKFSVSGGGDPLYNMQENIDFWCNIFNIGERTQKKVDIHTREKLYDTRFWGKVNKLVFSSDKPQCDLQYLSWVSQFVSTRVAHVVTSKTTTTMATEYIAIAETKNIEITFKKISGFSDGGAWDDLKKRYSGKIYFLDEGDYNIYYMPNNTTTEKFIELTL